MFILEIILPLATLHLLHQIAQHIIQNPTTLEILHLIHRINPTGHNNILAAAIRAIDTQGKILSRHKFLSLTTAAQLVYLFMLVFIITTNLWQLLIMVVATNASEYVLYEMCFLKADKYDLLTTRMDIG